MGMHCPVCQTHQAIVRNDTADGEPVTKENPVIRRKLACGHTVGGPGYAEYIAKINAAKLAAYNAHEAVDAKLREDLAALSVAAVEAGKV